MIAEQLKKSILQAAIQGKLTEQLPEDGDARDLLKDIKKEKAQLIKEGKIKKEKSLPEITDDVLPFDIPGNWCWVRLGDIGETNIGLTYKPSDISNEGTIVLRSGNIQNGKIDYHDIVKVNLDIPENKKCHTGDLLICARNGSIRLVGKTAIIDNEGMTFGAFMAIYRSQFDNYVYYYLSSPYFRADFDGVSTTTINQITQDNFKNRLIPLPPIAEQNRIVKNLGKILPEIEILRNEETRLEDIQKSFPKKMKGSILQAAIQGKLTGQLRSDGNARDLLKEIQKGKNRLIKEGKIKKEKPLTEITEDEIPFDIPENWAWVRLGEISEVSAGTTPNNKYIVSDGNIPFYKVSDMNTFGNEKYMNIAQEYLSDEYKNYLLETDTIIYPKNGGAVFTNKRRITTKPCLVDLNTGYCKPYWKTSIDYLYFWFSSINFVNFYSGTVLPTVSAGIIKNLLIPIPPLTEQSRIVQRLEELLPLCKAI